MARKKTIRVVHYGLGPIGILAAQWLVKKDGYRIVGAIDIDEKKVGKDLGTLIGSKKKLGVKVSSDANAVLKKAKADVVIHTTTSFIKDVKAQLELCIKAGCNVVSSTEELLLPDLQNPQEARRLDALARKYGVCVLGTGVNPGFIMDRFPVSLAKMCLEVKSIAVYRRLDAGKRRLPLQKKVGAGMDLKEWKALARAGKLGHLGLPESLHYIGRALGWEFDRITHSLKPQIASRNLETKYVKIKKGQATGIKEAMSAYIKGKKVLSLDLRMYVGESDPEDGVIIKGTPNINCIIKGGTAGDEATAAALIHGIPLALLAPPGLIS